MPSLIIAALIGTCLFSPLSAYESFLGNLKRLLFGYDFIILISIVGGFLICYWGLHIPYHSNILKMSWAYYPALTILCAITILSVGCLSNNSDLIDFIWLFCIGSLIFCLLTVGITLLTENRGFQLYGNVNDIRYLLTGNKKSINTPGIANLLCLFPATFFAGLILKPNQRPRGYWVFGTVGSLLSLAAALAIGQRSYFAITLIISPLIISFFLLLTRQWRSCFAIIFTLTTYPILLKFDAIFGLAYLNRRPVDLNIVKDARFEMFKYWFNHFLEDPLQRIEVGPPPWDSLHWFHNFFADIHRLSGLWALLTAVILVAYIFYRVMCVISKERRVGLFLMAVAIPNFLIINTSVVPEGERQPFLLLLAVGVISEVILANLKLASSSESHNEPGSSSPMRG